MCTSGDRGRRITDPGATARATKSPEANSSVRALLRSTGRRLNEGVVRWNRRDWERAMIRKTYGIDIVALTLAIIVAAAILMIGSALMHEVADPIPPALRATD